MYLVWKLLPRTAGLVAAVAILLCREAGVAGGGRGLVKFRRGGSAGTLAL